MRVLKILSVATMLAAVTLMACSREMNVGPPESSGIEGYVFIGPTCPVVMEGADCDDKPYGARLIILDAEKRTRLREVVPDGPTGRFRIPLFPGHYVIVPESGDPLPFAPEQSVTVVDGEFTQVTVVYDNGIR